MKLVLNTTLFVMGCGYLMYSIAWERWTLLLSRFLIGAGAGNVSVLRYYANGATCDRRCAGPPPLA